MRAARGPYGPLAAKYIFQEFPLTYPHTVVYWSVMENNNNALDAARSLYSDLYKDLYGVRPRGYSEWTLAELDAAIEVVSAHLAEEIEEERYREEKSLFDMFYDSEDLA